MKNVSMRSQATREAIMYGHKLENRIIKNLLQPQVIKQENCHPSSLDDGQDTSPEDLADRILNSDSP